MIIDGKEGFTFGCDPECFIVDKDGTPVPAAGIIPGTKEEPHPVEGGAVQVDGMAAEFNIDPAKSFLEFNRNITSVMKALTAMLPEGCTLSAVPSIRFPKEVFDDAPDDAKVLGCNPDFNAWTGEINPPPSPEMIGDPYLRTAAGHLHIGWTEDADLGDIQHVMNCRDLVKQLDWYLGGWSLRVDKDAVRRSLYGKAGAMRPKTYGVEYRVLSNFWITTRERRLAVWNRMQIAIRDMSRVFVPDQVRNVTNAELQVSIDTSTRIPDLERRFRYPLTTIDASYSRF